MKLKVVKILAYGSSKRYMWIETPNGNKCLFIDEKTYQWLKNNNVPTSQSIRGKK